MTSSSNKINVRHLGECPELLANLVEWFETEWEPYYGSGGPGDARADLSRSMNRDVLPICLVGLDEDGTLAGTISLTSTSVSHPKLSPWGAAFLVASDRRGQSIGTKLVEALEREAVRLGFETLYMSTNAANGILERRRWKAIDTAESLRGIITVYELDLCQGECRQRHLRPPSVP